MPLPAELNDEAFLLRTGWTWQQLMDTPQDVVSKMILLINAEAEVSKARAEQGSQGFRR